ncbi:MAG: hypothetical protein IJ091_04815 [Oscillospiraceae bacterium]|nr:hypothetical protein [Oscillospiraceae bacterium]
MKKKIAAIAAILIALMALLTGCGTNSSIVGEYVAYDYVTKDGAHHEEAVENALAESYVIFREDGTGELGDRGAWYHDSTEIQWKSGLFGNKIMADGYTVGKFREKDGGLEITLYYEEEGKVVFLMERVS